MKNPKKLKIQRLCDLDEWEFYQIAGVGSEDAIFTIGLRPYSELRQVEYEVWGGDGGDEKPRLTGGVNCDNMRDDESRARVLRAILTLEHAGIVSAYEGIEVCLRDH